MYPLVQPCVSMASIDVILANLPRLGDVYEARQRVVKHARDVFGRPEFDRYVELYESTRRRCSKYGSIATLSCCTRSELAMRYDEDHLYLPGYIKYLEQFDAACELLRSINVEPVLELIFSFEEYMRFVRLEHARGVLDECETDPV
jgi:hypothetical protein